MMPIVMFPTFILQEWSGTLPSAHARSIREIEFICQSVQTDAPESSWALTMERLVALLDEDEDDEYGVLAPTPTAFQTALKLVRGAQALASAPVAPASVVTDSSGGVRLTWRVGLSEVRLVCPASADEHVYSYEKIGELAPVVVSENLTGEHLARALATLSQL